MRHVHADGQQDGNNEDPGAWAPKTDGRRGLGLQVVGFRGFKVLGLEGSGCLV